jgi:Transposase, Mutator family
VASGNSRNGISAKTVLTDIGSVDLAVPRDRNASFEPQIVHKGVACPKKWRAGVSLVGIHKTQKSS